MRIAIIGAGISGLNLGLYLGQQAEVVVFEKSRGVGGRMSTRRSDGFCFDHGTQCFTARTDAFQHFLAPFVQQGLVKEWTGQVVNLEHHQPITPRFWDEPHLVASPNMNSLCKALAEGQDIKLQTEVAPLEKKTQQTWRLRSTLGEDLGDYDWVISTAPPAQTLNLFKAYLPQDNPLNKAKMQGCYALMLGFDRPWDAPWIAAKVKKSLIKWISINSTKPGRDTQVTAMVLHSRNSWADQMPQNAQTLMVKEFEKITGLNTKEASHISSHFWRYALVKKSEKAGGYCDHNLKIAAVSDWAHGSRIEDAWLTSTDLMRKII